MISVVINTLNEEANISECLRSVQSLADEILICDMYSEDRTVEIAKSFGARVIYHERTGFVEPARFYAISSARHDWILVLDADERMTEPLANKLKEIAQANAVQVVSFRRLNWYFGGWVYHGQFFHGDQARFFRKSAYLECYRKSEEKVHQNFAELAKHPGKLRLPPDYYILHLAYPTIEKYACKTLGMYARLEAEQMFQDEVHFHLWRLFWEPMKSFIKNYVYLQAFREGIRGFVLSVLYALYRFNIWANLWLLETNKGRELYQG